MASTINRYASHSNQYLYQGKVFVSTFSGHDCGDAAWRQLKSTLSGQGVNIYFVPAFFGGTSWKGWTSMDGEVSPLSVGVTRPSSSPSRSLTPALAGQLEQRLER